MIYPHFITDRACTAMQRIHRTAEFLILENNMSIGRLEESDSRLNDIIGFVKVCEPCKSCKMPYCMYARKMIKKYKIKTTIITKNDYKYIEIK